MSAYYAQPNPNYDYVVRKENHPILAKLLMSTLALLEQTYGVPMMADVPGPAKWTDVLARDLYPEVPLLVWQAHSQAQMQVIIPLPFDFIRRAEKYLEGDLPTWLVVKGKESKPHAPDEGVDYLRYLTNRDLPGGEDKG